MPLAGAPSPSSALLLTPLPSSHLPLRGTGQLLPPSTVEGRVEAQGSGWGFTLKSCDV